MTQLKRLAATLTAATLCLSIFAGCSSSKQGSSVSNIQESLPPTNSVSLPEAVNNQEAKPVVRIGTLQGPAGIGMVRLMEQNENRKTSNIYEFTIAGAPDELSGKMISGELDIAAVPTNMAAVLYDRTDGNVKIISTTTLGVLYLLEQTLEEASGEENAETESSEEGGEIETFADLAGKAIYSTGQGATQEYVLNYLLEKNGVADATIAFRSEHAELATLVLEGQAKYALLPQPFVTTVTLKDKGVRIALDITKEWESATGSQLAMGAVVVRGDFLEKNQATVDSFLSEFADSARFANESVEEAAALCGRYEMINEDVAKKAIPGCNIVCLTGDEMKGSVSNYLNVLFNAEPKSVGGSLPDDPFYYVP